MTRGLVKRVWEHKAKVVPGFTTKYGVDRLVWYEQHRSLESAFTRERQIKEWKRRPRSSMRNPHIVLFVFLIKPHHRLSDERKAAERCSPPRRRERAPVFSL